MEAQIDKESDMFHFDTGYATSHLSVVYFEKHKEDIFKEAEAVIQGGFGGVVNKNSYRLPSVTFKVVGKDVPLKNIKIDTIPSYSFESVESVTLEMFIILE